MNKFYWKIRKMFLRIIFEVKKRLFLLDAFEYKAKLNVSFYFRIATELFKHVLVNACILFLLYKIDNNFVPTLKLTTDTTKTLFSDVLISALGISGVFLGLYCSNMMSVFTSRYINAPDVLVNLFEEDLLTNKCLNIISDFIITATIVLILNLMGIIPGAVLITYLFVRTVIIIISYSFSGKRIFHISNVSTISARLYQNIYKAFKTITKSKLFFQDTNFQHHCYKVVDKNLDFIETIVEYTNQIDTAKEPAIKAFLENNLDLLGSYWKLKPSIPFDSEWYCEKIVYSKWHRADDHEIDLALRTGTSINPQKMKDYFWVETKILKLNEMCLDTLLNNNVFTNMYRWVSRTAELSESAVGAESLIFYLQCVNQVRQKVLEQVANQNAVFSITEKMAMVENIMGVYINTIIAIRKYLQKMDIEAVLEEATSYSKISQLPINQYFNHNDVQTLYECIDTEYKIEKCKVTPNWYIKQVIAKHIYKSMIEIYTALDNIFNNDVPAILDMFIKNKLYAETMVVYSKITELNSKARGLTDTIESYLSLLKKHHIETSIVWESNPITDFEEKQKKFLSEMTENWCKYSCLFSLKHNDELESLPDFLGECYNYICASLMDSIVEEDFDSFSAGYKNLWNFTFVYWENVRKDLLNIKEQYLQDRVFRVFSSPFIECGYISGYAYLLGEITNKECWKTLVVETFNDFIGKFPEESGIRKRNCEIIVSMLNSKHFVRPGIYNRDIIHTRWKQVFEGAIREKEYLKWKDDLYVQAIDTDSSLLKAVISYHDTFSLLRCEAYEIFANQILNTYLDEGKKYKSITRWEERL